MGRFNVGLRIASRSDVWLYLFVHVHMYMYVSGIIARYAYTHICISV